MLEHGTAWLPIKQTKTTKSEIGEQSNFETLAL